MKKRLLTELSVLKGSYQSRDAKQDGMEALATQLAGAWAMPGQQDTIYLLYPAASELKQRARETT